MSPRASQTRAVADCADGENPPVPVATVKVRVRVCECGARYSTPGVARLHRCPLADGGTGTFRTVTETRDAEPSRISYQPGYRPGVTS